MGHAVHHHMGLSSSKLVRKRDFVQRHSLKTCLEQLCLFHVEGISARLRWNERDLPRQFLVSVKQKYAHLFSFHVVPNWWLTFSLASLFVWRWVKFWNECHLPEIHRPTSLPVSLAEAKDAGNDGKVDRSLFIVEQLTGYFIELIALWFGTNLLWSNEEAVTNSQVPASDEAETDPLILPIMTATCNGR